MDFQNSLAAGKRSKYPTEVRVLAYLEENANKNVTYTDF